MSLYKRKTTWWVRFTAPNGTRVRRSAQTSNKAQAQELHDKLKAQYWNESKLKEKPKRTWQKAVIRWLDETQHKASHEDDKMHLRWINQYVNTCTLEEINRDTIDRLIKLRLDGGVSHATVNRTMAVLRAILRKAEREWEWLAKAPCFRLLPEPKRRIRWLTRNEAQTLLALLPDHLESIVRFTLATGLRSSNVTRLTWSQIDMSRHLAWIHADQAKAKRSISVPLNKDALCVLRKQLGEHDEFVFTYHGNPIKQASTKAWRQALKKAGIQDFRFHDLRHTWASWHVQQGTPLAVLQELGGWENSEMVRRYAHLGKEHTAAYADQLSLHSDTNGGSSGTNLAHVA